MFKKFFAKRKKLKITLIILAVLFLFGVLSVSAALNKKAQPEYATAKIERQNLLQTVSEVGAVKSAEEIKLSFPVGGKMAVKPVKIGDQVMKGQVLAELDSQSLAIQKTEMEASLNGARASLAKLIQGASAQEIAVASAQAAQAEKNYLSALDNADKTKKTTAEELKQAQKTLSDLQDESSATITTYEQSVITAINNLNNTKALYQKTIDNSADTLLIDIGAKISVADTAIDNINKIVTENAIQDGLSSKDKTILEKTKTAKEAAKNLETAASASLNIALASRMEGDIKKSSNDAADCLKKTIEALNYCYDALEASTFTQTLIDTYKTTISAQITAANAALSVLQADRQGLDNAYLNYNNNVVAAENALQQAQVAKENAVLTAKNSLASAKNSSEQRNSAAQNSANTAQEAYSVAQKQLAQLRAPARAEDIALAQSKVQGAEASLALIKKQIEDSFLRSPIDGRIVRDDYEIGEQVMSGSPAFAVLAENSFEIEVDISESDIAKIKEGNKVEITLDAFGEDVKFSGEISFVEPAETIIQEVIYYKVKIKFTDEKEKLAGVKSGMTANTKIITAQKENVLVIPERAVLDKDGGGKMTRILRGGKIIEAPIKIGLRGDDGLAEIISGANAGDEVVTFIKNAKK